MQVFELHFNPKNTENRIIDAFSYQPVNIYEKRLGNLYMAGELNQVMPQNSRFLNNLASVIQKEYYSAGLKKSCQQSLQDSLKKANEFLDEQVQKGNVSWLGNLNFAVLNFKDFVLNFTKVGDIKIFLVRNSEVLEISQGLEFQDIDPYPLKIFGNIATGQLSQNDKIVILNAKNENFLNQLSKISDEKGLKEFLKRKKQILTEVSGICLLILVNEESTSKQTLTFHQDVPKFSFRETFKIPKIKLTIPRKKIILVLGLILALAIGFFIFR